MNIYIYTQRSKYMIYVYFYIEKSNNLYIYVSRHLCSHTIFIYFSIYLFILFIYLFIYIYKFMCNIHVIHKLKKHTGHMTLTLKYHLVANVRFVFRLSGLPYRGVFSRLASHRCTGSVHPNCHHHRHHCRRRRRRHHHHHHRTVGLEQCVLSMAAL